jgi:hypothetical protein
LIWAPPPGDRRAQNKAATDGDSKLHAARKTRRPARFRPPFGPRAAASIALASENFSARAARMPAAR